MPVQLASPSGVAPPGVLPATYRYRTTGTRGVGVAPGAAPCYAGFFARHDLQEPKWEEAGGRLVPVQLTSPSGVAGTQGTPGPRSRDGLPDRDDVPGNVRLVPAEWVRPWVPRLATLASWTGTVPTNLRGHYLEAH